MSVDYLGKLGPPSLLCPLISHAFFSWHGMTWGRQNKRPYRGICLVSPLLPIKTHQMGNATVSKWMRSAMHFTSSVFSCAQKKALVASWKRRRLASLRWVRHNIKMCNMEDSNVIRLVYWCCLLVCFDSHTARQDVDVVEGKPFLCLTPFCVTFQSRRCRQPFYHSPPTLSLSRSLLLSLSERERERRLIGGMILPRPLLCPKIRHTR